VDGIQEIIGKNYKTFAHAFRHGFEPVNGEAVTIKDVLATSNAGVWIPKIVQEIIKEAVEPAIILTGLLERIPVQKGTHTISLAMGALEAADVAEGEEYPEKQIQIGGATTTAQVGKSGLRVKMTEEVLSRSQFDIINAHIRAAGRALSRWKEEKVANYLTLMGTAVFDNHTPTSSLLGVTTGRGFDGTANGSMTWDDLFDMSARLIDNGFMPNTLIMHPLMWAVWMKDPVLRLFALNAGGGSWWGSYSGEPAGKSSWGGGSAHTTSGQNIVPGSAASGAAASEHTDYPQWLQSAPTLPSHMSPWPISVIVSPFVYYDPAAKVSDIILCDRRELGALLVEEEITTEQNVIFDTDMREIKFRERYAIMIYEEGLGIATAKNVKAIANEIVLPATATFDTSTIPTITSTVPVV